MENSIVMDNERVGELEAQNAFLKLRIRLYDKALKKLVTDSYSDKHYNNENNIYNNNKLKNGIKLPNSNSKSPLTSNIKIKNDNNSNNDSKDDINVSYSSPNNKKKIIIDNKAFRAMMKAAVTNLSPSTNIDNKNHNNNKNNQNYHQHHHHLDYNSDGSWLEDDGPIPRFSEHQSILINELQTTLINLKLGFRKREQAFIDKSKERDYAATLLHKTENDTIEDIKHICETLCNSMEMIENDIEESGKTAQDLMKTAIIESQQTLIAAIELQKENKNIKETLNDAIEQIFNIKADLVTVTTEKVNITDELNTKRDENSNLLSKIMLLEKEVNTNADEILALRSIKTQQDEEIVLLRASEQSINAKNDTLEKEREKNNIMIYENETQRFFQKKELEGCLAKKEEEMQVLLDINLALRTENEALKAHQKNGEDIQELLHHVDELLDNVNTLQQENDELKKKQEIAHQTIEEANNHVERLLKENLDAEDNIEKLLQVKAKYDELLKEQATEDTMLSIHEEISSSLNEKLASLNEEKSKIETDRALEEMSKNLDEKVAENILLENKLIAATFEIESVRLEQSNLISTYKNEIESVKIEKKNLDSLFMTLATAQQDIDNLKVKNALLSQEIAVANEERIRDKITIDRLTSEQNSNMLDFAATISALAAITSQ